jgi:hypothetical protein
MKSLKHQHLKLSSKTLFVFENNKAVKKNRPGYIDTTTSTITLTGTIAYNKTGR